jgi:hypothetical protein
MILSTGPASEPPSSTAPTARSARTPAWLGVPREILAANDARLTVTLGGLALVLAAATLFYNLFLPLTPARTAKPSADLFGEVPLWAFLERTSPPALQNADVVAALLVGFVLVSFLAYALAVYLSWNRARASGPLSVVLAGGVAFFYVSTWALPSINTDIFNYIARGRLAAAHGANPYYVAVDQFPEDPIYPYASHRYTATPGGKFPTWMLLNISLARLAGDDPVTNLIVYRTALFLFNAANLALIGILCRRFQPRALLAGVTLYGWNPIVVVFGENKTDVVMLFFLLLGALLLSGSRRRLGVVALTLSVFVKLITAPLLVVHFLREARLRRWRELAAGAALSTATAIAIYLPFLQDPGLPFRHLFKMGEGGSEAASVLRPIVTLGFLVVVPWVGLTRRQETKHLVYGWSLVILYFSLFLTNFAFSWYLITLVAVAALTSDWRMFVATIALSFSSFLMNLWEASSTSEFPLPYAVLVHRHVVYLAPLAAVGGAVIGYVFWHRRRAAARASGMQRQGLSLAGASALGRLSEGGSSSAAPRTLPPEADRSRLRSPRADRPGPSRPSESGEIPRAEDRR